MRPRALPQRLLQRRRATAVHPHDFDVFGLSLPVWNSVFALAVVLAAFVFRRSAAMEPRLGFALLRYFVFVYLSALAAQVFAYAFDVNTSLTPPPGVGLAVWYLSPVAGPKTLYGVLVLAPVSVAVATLGTRIPLGRGLDLWTPAILTVLATVRVGCLLQGCCFGRRSDLLGVSFPAGSAAYWQQVGQGLLAADAARSLPVIPTQALEAAFLAGLAVWAGRRQAGGGLFVPAVVLYSAFRFAIEFVRADSERGIYAGLATSQWIALVVLAAALAARGRRVLALPVAASGALR